MTAQPPSLGQGLGLTLGLGPIDQVAYVVADLDASLPRYTALFGPFQLAESPLSDCTYRGERADCRLRLAVNRSAPVEIELLQVLEGQSPLADHLREHGEGLHHVRFRVDALDAKLEELARANFNTVFYKRFAPGVAFAYVESPLALGCSVIELLELPPGVSP